MAYRAPNDDLMLHEAEQTEALRELGHRGKWEDLTPSDRIHATLKYLSANPEKHPDRKAAAETPPAPVHKCEVTWSQLDKFFTNFTTEIIECIKRNDAALESQFATALEDALAAAEATRKQAGASVDVERLERLETMLSKFVEKTTDTLTSHDRRISRHAENLNKLNDERRR